MTLAHYAFCYNPFYALTDFESSASGKHTMKPICNWKQKSNFKVIPSHYISVKQKS